MYSRCPECLQNAAAQKAEDEQRRAAQERRQKVRGILDRASIPPRFADRSFANYSATKTPQRIALVACRQYADSWESTSDSGSSLVLTGGPGTGKTHLACAIANQVTETNLAAPLFMTTTEMLRRIKSTYRKDSEMTEQGAINSIAHNPDLLIIDEVGVQVGSDHEKLLLFEILNERYQCLRPTVLISNLTATELETYLGQRVMDRYRECGAVIAFNWESHRGAANQ